MLVSSLISEGLFCRVQPVLSGRVPSMRRNSAHTRPGCRGLNVTKASLEGLFVDELARLQPSAGYMRLLKESVVKVWKERQSAVQTELQAAEHARQKLQRKLDRLDEAFLFERSIDIDTYDRHADRVREQVTLL